MRRTLSGRHDATVSQLLLHYGDALANNPAVIALLNLLELARYGFRRRDVLDVLRSPYFAVPGIDEADR